MPKANRVVELASTILSNASKFEAYRTSQGWKPLSLDTDVPVNIGIPEDVAESRDTVLDAVSELQMLMLGPLGILQIYGGSHNHLLGLQTIYRFNIATVLPVNEEASYEDLSKACGLNEPDLRRILRYAMTTGIFKEPRKGIVAHTGASRLLAKSPMLRDWIGLVCEEMWPSATRAVDAMVQWPTSQEPNHTGFSIANKTADGFFDDLTKHPSRAARFANAMSLFSSADGFEPRHLLNAFSWASLGAGVVVDVGGSHGSISIALARSFPSLRCVVQDLPETVAKGKSEIPPDVLDRVDFMAHDFFTDQPIHGADVYLLRWVLHDWSDKYCIKILRCLIPAMKTGARILVNDFCVPEPGTVSLLQERSLRSFDLAMLELQNSKERDEADWAKLFESADSKFKFLGVVRPPKPDGLALIQAVWDGPG